MPELREVFDMTTKQMGEPDLDSWREQERRQRTKNRNKKLGAISLAAVLVIIAVVIGISTMDSETTHRTPGSEPTLPPGQGAETLSIVDVGSGRATGFVAPAGASDFDVTADGSMVAYTDLDPDGNPQVFVMDADGSSVRQLTHGEGDLSTSTMPGTGEHGGLDWSPDGSMIAYQRETSDGPQIFTVRVSDGVSTQVTDEPRGAVDPGGWAPDGGSLIFSTPNLSVSHYTAMSLDLATGRTTLVVPDGSTPVLSPDGASIAFNSWLKTHIRLILANSDGTGRHVIARFDGDDGYEQWSPDSTQVAFIARMGNTGFGTYVYDVETGETRFVSGGTLESWIDDDHILVS